jgi:hypothetical protein
MALGRACESCAGCEAELQAAPGGVGMTMEKCNYCGFEYHPMLRATKYGKLIYICEYRFTFDENGELGDVKPTEECKEKALADGFTLRRDLTPRR